MKVKTEPLCGPTLITTYLHGYVKRAGCPIDKGKEDGMAARELGGDSNSMFVDRVIEIRVRGHLVSKAPFNPFVHMDCAECGRPMEIPRSVHTMGLAEWGCDHCHTRHLATVQPPPSQSEWAAIRGGHPAQVSLSEIARLEKALAQTHENWVQTQRQEGELRVENDRLRRSIERASERAEQSVRRAGDQARALDELRAEGRRLHDCFAAETAELASANVRLAADAAAMRKAIDDHLAERKKEQPRRRRFRLEPVSRRTTLHGPAFEFEAEHGRPFYLAIRRALKGEGMDYQTWKRAELQGAQGATLILPEGVEIECYELVSAEPLDFVRR